MKILKRFVVFELEDLIETTRVDVKYKKLCFKIKIKKTLFIYLFITCKNRVPQIM